MNANFRVRILENQLVHIRRVLPGSGKLKAVVNQEVMPDDIIGSYTLDAGYSSVNLRRELGVAAPEGIKYLQVPLGRFIYKGELLAYKKSIFGDKVITAPTDGLIEEYNPKTGDLRLKFLSKELPMTSGVFGIVDGIDQRNGEVLVRTIATKVYGVIGSGRERGGILHLIGNSSNLVSGIEIKEDMHRQIIVTGALIYGEALRKAAVIGVSGIISGGLNLSDYLSIVATLDPHDKLGTDVGISLMATEGFGLIPIGEDIFNLIKSFNGKFDFVNGNLNLLLLPAATSSSILAVRKATLPILPLSKSPIIKPELRIVDLNLGDLVRIIWPPFMGAQGKIIAIDKSTSMLESGISTYLVAVQTQKKMIKVPFPNLEVLSSHT